MRDVAMAGVDCPADGAAAFTCKCKVRAEGVGGLEAEGSPTLSEEAEHGGRARPESEAGDEAACTKAT